MKNFLGVLHSWSNVIGIFLDVAGAPMYDDGGEAHDERERTTRARTTDERCSSEKTHAMKRTKRRKQLLTG